MGTRNLTVVIKDNKIKLSQYGQWDGYFSYTGVKFLDFVKKNLQAKSNKEYKRRIEQFKEKIDLLEDISEESYNKYLEIYDQIGTSTKNTSNYSIPFSIMFPQFSRDTGVEILNIVNGLRSYELGGKKFPVQICLDSGWTEFINVIDLDNEEIYMFTNHVFNVEVNYEVPSILDTFGMDCYYKAKIKNLPSIKEIKEYKERIELDVWTDNDGVVHSN